MPKKKKTEQTPEGLSVLVVLDRSGSMQICKAETISAYNAYITDLAKATPEAMLALMQFDSQGIDTTPSKKVGEVDKLNDETFQPRSFTPLLDAIGKGVALLDKAAAGRKALVVLTDGEENASREYSKDAIKKLLDERQNQQGWLVIFLGANQDAITEGAKLGSSYNNTMTFDTQNVGATMAAVSRATQSYAMATDAHSGRLRASFSAGEREAAVKKPGARGARAKVEVDIWGTP